MMRVRVLDVRPETLEGTAKGILDEVSSSWTGKRVLLNIEQRRHDPVFTYSFEEGLSYHGEQD